MFINNNGHDPDEGNAQLVLLDNGEIIAFYSSWKFAYIDLQTLDNYDYTGRYKIKRACAI